MSHPLSALTAVQFRRAADLKEKIEALTKELSLILGASAPVSAKSPKKKRTMSASARAKIAAAQKARWARVRAGK